MVIRVVKHFSGKFVEKEEKWAINGKLGREGRRKEAMEENERENVGSSSKK